VAPNRWVLHALVEKEKRVPFSVPTRLPAKNVSFQIVDPFAHRRSRQPLASLRRVIQQSSTLFSAPEFIFLSVSAESAGSFFVQVFDRFIPRCPEEWVYKL
jgi:hypothetical protein